jgi:hypothetical protein
MLFLAGAAPVFADGRPGSVEWSDGRKLAGAISLTDGKDLRLSANDQLVSIPLEEVKQIVFAPEKEEMWEGFYFPNAGQTTQVKTGEVYPIRYLKTEITLANGQTLEGHLYTTTFYVETDDTTEKVVVLAKQTGPDKSKLSDLVYPTTIRFDGGAAPASVQLDLTSAGFPAMQPPVVVTRPDLVLAPTLQSGTQPIWTVPVADPGQVFFSVQAADGFHVAWPALDADPDLVEATQAGLKAMRDFYDDRKMLGCVGDADSGDIESLVMMRRVGTTVSIGQGQVPWSLVILGWKYDPDAKKVTLLHRAMLGIGREDAKTPLPAVLKEPELFSDLSAIKQPTGSGPTP